LNPYIEDVARRLAKAGYMAFAPDGLTSVGGYPGDDQKGAAAFRTVDGKKMTEDFVAAAKWLKARPTAPVNWARWASASAEEWSIN
jgi:carboxymethylenebutenolidase